MKSNRTIVSFALVSALVFVASVTMNAQKASTNDNKQVTLLTKALEIVSVTQTAEQCKDHKGVTVKLSVIGDKPVDVRRYMGFRGGWTQKDFANQSSGSEIVDYSCYEKAPFKFYSRPVGSAGEFPKP